MKYYCALYKGIRPFDNSVAYHLQVHIPLCYFIRLLSKWLKCIREFGTHLQIEKIACTFVFILLQKVNKLLFRKSL